jgi:hypothetical protein
MPKNKEKSSGTTKLWSTDSAKTSATSPMVIKLKR